MKRAAILIAYLAVLLALDHFASYPEQLGLGVITWAVLIALAWRLPAFQRALVLGVVFFATIGEVTGSLIWGVYRYRLHNLPLFIPPAHGLVFLTGIAIAAALERRAGALVVTAAAAAATWGMLGLFVLPRRDVAGAIGVPLLLLFLWRSRNRAIYASVFLVVAALELYGTAIGTWRWARDAARARDPRRQPAVRSRLGLRLVRRDGDADRDRPDPAREQAQNRVERLARRLPRAARPRSVIDPAARGALQEAELEQVGLVDVLDRLGLLAERDRERRETDRARRRTSPRPPRAARGRTARAPTRRSRAARAPRRRSRS